ncbi:MAG: arginine--tRNA ligase [Deltaproteobacteria bacterium]|nr:arginine--tRNA ligase [Deltaproteobacteria bacterium]
MIKARLQEIVDRCFQEGVKREYWPQSADDYALETPKRQGQGDFSTNLALIAAGIKKKNPREMAAKLTGLLADYCDITDKIEIAGPGFVNFFIRDAVWQDVLPGICQQGESFGPPKIGAGKRVLVEFVSANPTGPLSVGHGRQAVLGDAIARLLEATGHEVTREYYYNDAGRQMRVLAGSLRARYLELSGIPCELPEDGYQGKYIYDIARELLDEQGDKLQGVDDLTPFQKKAEQAIFKDINGTLQRMGIHFDNYYNEHTLYDDGHIDDVVARLRDKGLVYEQDGAVWFKTSEFGLEKDRVIIKSTGEPTYRLPDIAYHREKFRRGFDWMVDIFGSDHIATVPDVMAGITALGLDASKVTVVLHQFVTLMRDGHQVKMSTRKATFVTLDDLLSEVGPDVVRFFFLMRKADSQLDFDLDLATQQSQENPVYYVQYGHARLTSIIRQAGERGIDVPGRDNTHVSLLDQPEEIALLRDMASYPELVKNAALDLAPHRVVFYLQELAAKFHSYYNKHRVISEEDLEMTKARLQLVRGIRIVLRNGLNLIGVDAPNSM